MLIPPSDPLVAAAVALLSEIASTSNASPGVCIDDDDPTSASVSAALVTSATDDEAAPVNTPSDITIAFAVASLSDVARAVTPDASVTSASNWTLVPPLTLASGSDTPNVAIPPPPTSESAVALLFDSAVTMTAPVTWIDPVDARVASTSAALVISALAPPPLTATAPRPATNASASAVLSPSACTVSALAPVITPSIFARTAPPTDADDATTPAAIAPVPRPVASASALFSPF